IVGRIERNLNLDAALGPDQVHSLIGYDLCATSEDRVAGGEIENHRCQAIDLHLRVSLDQRDNTRGLFSVDQPRGRDGIAADIEQTAAADIRIVADIAGVAIEV